MAENAELLLKVGLDLTHFRRQLNNIGSQLAGQPLSINVKLDRQKIVSEFRLLDRYIRNKKFYVEVNTNLKTEVDRAAKLTELLKNMPRGGGVARTPGVVEAGFSQSQLRKLKQDIKPLYKAAADAGLVAFNEAIANNVGKIAKELSEVGKSSIAGLLNGLSSGDAQVRAAAQSLGQILIATIKATLGIASPSKETGKLGKFAAEGFEKGFISSIVKSERRMARAIQLTVIGAIREGLTNLPGLGGALVGFERQLAAGIQLAVRRAVREGIVASIVPGAKGGLLGAAGGATTGAMVGGAKALGGGVAGGIAKLTAGGLMGTAANLARYSIDSSAYQEFVGKLYQEIINTALSTGSQGAIVGALAVGGVAGGIGFARGATGSLVVQAVTAIRNRILAALLAVSTGDLNNVVKVMVRDVTGAIFQKQIRQLRAATAQLPAINWPALTPSRATNIGPSGTGRLLAGAAPMQAISAGREPAGFLPSETRQSALTAGMEALMRALSAQSQAAGMGGPAGAIVSMESGFIAAMRERFARAAERYLFGVETEVVDLFDAAVRQVEVAVDQYIAKIQAQISRRARQGVSVVDLGAATRRMLGGGKVAGLLPAGVGRMPSPYAMGGAGGGLESRAEMFARREREARMRSALRGMDVMGGGSGRGAAPYSYAYRSARPLSAIVPYAPAGAIVPGGGGPGGGGPGGGSGGRPPGGGFGGFGGFGRAMGQINLPGSGLIRELGQDFAFATKQVLLFGQAYKLLGFLQSFPGQVIQASASLQSYRNSLQSVTKTSDEFEASSNFVLDLVDKYNIPLEAAEQGFLKLYASMAPAGFSGEEIRGLFTGISQAAATFGMSSDKVDRVTYAFAQMASKGQVMSEELKGQLGDVLPGAMAIFAAAAGLEGPDAIQKFSKALEDGAFKGENMVDLLKNVRIELTKEFGPGAEGAAKTVQGALTRMQNSVTLLYRAFEPIAVNFLNAVVVPVSQGLKTITDGFTAFFTGTAAKTAGGAAFANQLKELQPAFEGIRQNIQNLLPLLTTFGQWAAMLGKTLIQLAGNPFVGYLLRVYAIILPLTTAIKVLNLQAIVPLIASVLKAIPAFVAFTAAKIRLISTNKALQLTMQMTGNTASVTAGKIRLIGLALGSLIVPAVLLGIGALIEKFMALRGAVDGVRQATQQMVASISGLANAGAVRELRNIAADTQKQIKTFEQLKPLTGGGALGLPQRTPTKQEAEKLKEIGLGSVVGTSITGAPFVRDLRTFKTVVDERLAGLRRVAGEVQSKLPLASKISQDLARQTQQSPAAIDLTGEGKPSARGGADKAANEAKRLAEEIARQAQAASDALFAEQQRFAVLKETEPVAKAFAEYTANEATVQRELNRALAEAKSQEEKINLVKKAALQSRANALELERDIVQAGKEAFKTIEQIVIDQKEQLRLEQETQRLMSEGMTPERAKQVAEVRKLVRVQLEAVDEQIKQTKAAILEREAREGSTKAVEDLRRALRELEEDRKRAEGKGREAEAGVPEQKPKTAADYISEGMDAARKNLEELTNAGYQLVQAAGAIGDAFGESFKGLISGSMTAQQALANFFQSVGDYFADMAAKMIAEWIKMQIIGLAQSLLPGIGGMFGGAPSANTGGFAGMTVANNALGEAMTFQMMKFATGGIAPGGFKAFASGGIVTGPTMGLVGEGRYNEAIVPLPDGRSIPVDLGGAAGNQIVSNITVNVNNGQAQSNATGGNSSELGRKLEGAVKQVIVGELRPGGLLAGRR